MESQPRSSHKRVPNDKRELLARRLQAWENDQGEGSVGSNYQTQLKRFFAVRRILPGTDSGLLGEAASTLFGFLERASDADAYPYQLALSGKSGPRVRVQDQDYLMFSSYDYLGLIGDPRVDASAVEAVQRFGTGTGGVRLLTGTNELHHTMERELAKFKQTQAAVSFSSGYIANLAVVSALLGPTDRVVMDSCAHRSLDDACRLAGVPTRRFRHNDMKSLREQLQTPPLGRRTLIIADGVYSMDGDVCPLPELIAAKQEFGAFLLIDDSHSFGVLGVEGRGVDDHFGVDAGEVDIWTLSLAKAIPSNGGIVLTSQDIAVWLQHAAAPFIFSAALCAAAVAAISAAVAILREEPERLGTLHRNADMLRDGLQDLGFDTGISTTPIVPVILRDETTTVATARRLRDLGVIATPVIYPAVPFREARLRLCATAAHNVDDIECVLAAFRRVVAEGPLDRIRRTDGGHSATSASPSQGPTAFPGAGLNDSI